MRGSRVGELLIQKVRRQEAAGRRPVPTAEQTAAGVRRALRRHRERVEHDALVLAAAAQGRAMREGMLEAIDAELAQ
jgi:hypothetical protein